MNAANGDVKAQFELGLCYLNGDGVMKNYVEAYKWVLLAGTSAPRHSALTCNYIAKKMTAAQVAEAQAQAKKWQEEFEQSHSPKK